MRNELTNVFSMDNKSVYFSVKLLEFSSDYVF